MGDGCEAMAVSFVSRLEVRKTYKLYVGGEFVRTESGRYDPVESPKNEFLANVSRGSRKDLREAVRKARAAQPGWAGKTAYLKGQIFYRMAEMLEGRSESFAKLLGQGRGLSAATAKAEVRATIDLPATRLLRSNVVGCAHYDPGHRQSGRVLLLQLLRA